VLVLYTDLDYADDDVVLMAEQTETLRSALAKFHQTAEDLGLHLSCQKTNTPFTRSSKRPTYVFKIHVLIAGRLLLYVIMDELAGRLLDRVNTL